jgi:hypothetical protein
MSGKDDWKSFSEWISRDCRNYALSARLAKCIWHQGLVNYITMRRIIADHDTNEYDAFRHKRPKKGVEV